MHASSVRYRSDVVAAIAVAIVGIVLTTLVVSQQRNSDYNKAAQRFAEEVRVSTDAIAKRINLYTEIVTGLRDLFLANPALTRTEFEHIAAVHNVIGSYPEILNVRFVRWYPELSRADDRYVIDYIWPKQGNETVLGMDISSQTANMDGVHAARNTGLPTVSAPFTLVQDQIDSPAIVLRMPVYAWTADAKIAGNTHTSFVGTVGAVINVNAMLVALSHAGGLSHVAVSLEDTGLTLGPENSSASHTRLLGSYTHAGAVLHPSDVPVESRTIDVLGRRWTLHYTPAADILPPSFSQSLWWVGGAGLALTIMLSLLTMVLVRQRVQKLDRAHEQITYLTYHDPLTQLPNRQLLRTHIQRALHRPVDPKQWGAVMLLDMDHFKSLNETRGHEQGDQMLFQVAQRLRQHVPEESFVARQGDDEFLVLVPSLGIRQELASAGAAELANHLLAQIEIPFLLGDGPYHTTASLGFTLFRGNQISVDALLKRAELAMHNAKMEGRNTATLYDPSLEVELTTRATLEHDMRSGLASGQFALHFQPQVHNNRIVGAEALLRWRHPDRGLVSPALFIPLAERTGFIVSLGRWVVRHACQQLAAWATQPEFAGLHLSVNISPLEFHQEGFVDEVLALIRRTGAPAQRLRLELTEGVLLQDINHTIAKMDTLQRHGITFSLDDFGTGYSSLSYLTRMPLTELKIDQSFVRHALEDSNVAVITQMIIALAKTLQLQVLAEGVETEGQRDFLVRHGCHVWQGYLFGRPVPLADFQVDVRRQPDPSKIGAC